jgi:glycosyltransferase involved in cell wall biosynthesis
MGAGPEIAVVVGAYRRTEFVERAIVSVLGQTVPRSAYEIVVVTDFDTSALRARFASDGVRFVRDGEPHIGRWFRGAIRQTRAPYLAILDDDDEFEPERLAEALAVFHAHPEVGLYRNRVRPIDREGRRIPERDWRPIDLDTEIERRGTVLVAVGDRAALAPFLTEEAGVAFNASTMIVRRDLLDGASEDVFALTELPDFALVVLAVTRPSALYLDARRLTRYRFQGSSVSSRTGWLPHAIEGHASLAAVARSRGRDDLAQWLGGLSVHYDRLYRGETVVQGVRERASRRTVVSSALSYLQFLGRHPAERAARLDVWSAALYAGGYVVLPGVTRRIALARPTGRHG